MSKPKLVIGSKNSSSWSLRPWLLLKQGGVPFEEVVIPLRRPDTHERIRLHSPSGKVPVLIVGEVRIWDSLAIAEFLAEHDTRLWPADSRARAFARSISAEMHSGFQALRTFLPMDFTARFRPPGRLLSGVEADIRRILEIWTECRQRHGQSGPFLFGAFSIADAMFAPVCSRFTTYAVPLDPVSQAYVAHMMSLPAMLEWGRDAAAELAAAPPAASPRTEQTEELERLPAAFAPMVLAADLDAPVAPPEIEDLPEPVGEWVPAPAPARQATATSTLVREPPPPLPTAPAREEPPAQPAEEPRRTLRPIPSTIMIKPIGDGTRRRR
jgi:glutathione S-transferase